MQLPDLSNCNFNSGKPRETNSNPENLNQLPNIAGNVREWTINSHGKDRKAILGGSYDTNEYTFNSFYSLSPFNRSNQKWIKTCQKFVAKKFKK